MMLLLILKLPKLLKNIVFFVLKIIVVAGGVRQSLTKVLTRATCDRRNQNTKK